MADLEAIHQHIEEHEQEHIAQVQDFLRQPSISAEDRGVRECGHARSWQRLANAIRTLERCDRRLWTERFPGAIYRHSGLHREFNRSPSAL